MSQRVLVLWFSQSGQLRQVAEAFCAPLEAAGHEVHFVEVAPSDPFPFPWKVTSFFGIFPETVREAPIPLAPLSLPEVEWDRIVIASQVWFLSPSQPFSSFLRSPQARVLEGKRVLTLIGCRNMWINGWRRLVQHITDLGGNVTDRVVVTHSGSIFASYFSTLAWMLTGKRDAIKVLPRAGLASDALQRITDLGRVAAGRMNEEVWLEGETTASVSHMHALGEQLAARLFPLLAAFYAATSSPGSPLRKLYAVAQLLLTLSLVFLLVLPCFVTRLFLGRWLDPWLDRLASLPVKGGTPGARPIEGLGAD